MNSWLFSLKGWSPILLSVEVLQRGLKTNKKAFSDIKKIIGIFKILTIKNLDPDRNSPKSLSPNFIDLHLQHCFSGLHSKQSERAFFLGQFYIYLWYPWALGKYSLT
jgi:hypothetical protein